MTRVDVGDGAGRRVDVDGRGDVLDVRGATTRGVTRVDAGIGAVVGTVGAVVGIVGADVGTVNGVNGVSVANGVYLVDDGIGFDAGAPHAVNARAAQATIRACFLVMLGS